MVTTVPSDRRPFPAVVTPPTGAAGWATLTLLGGVLVLALGLRLWGLSQVRGYHLDERFYAAKAEDMLGRGDPNPRYFENPSLFTYLIAGELLVTRVLGVQIVPRTPDAAPLAFLLARVDSALLGTASVALVFATGAALFGRRVGLLAALFLAVSFLHVRNSHYGVNDVPSAALLALSLYFDARLLRQPAPRWYLLAGLAGGLATSTKYTAGFFFAPLLAAHWLARRPAGERPYGRAAWAALVLAGAASLGGYLLGTPYTVLDFGRFSADFLEQGGKGRSWGQPDDPVPLLYLTTLLQGFGALPLGLALAGLLLAWRRRRAEALLLLAFPAAYLAFFLPREVFYPRLAIPLLPFCALLAGYGAARLGGWLCTRVRRPWRAAGPALLLGAALAQPLTSDVLHNRVMQRTDTQILASDWIRTNVPPGSRLMVGGYSVTGRFPDLVLEEFGFSPRAERLADAAARGVRYVVISSFVYGRDGGRAGLQRLHRDLEREAELIARFSPGVGGHEVPFRKEDATASPFWRLEEYERPGPTIRIYSLAPPIGEN